MKYTIFQYFFQTLVIPTLPLRALFNYNALLHSNGDHFFNFSWNRLLVPSVFGSVRNQQVIEIFRGQTFCPRDQSLRVNIIVCLLQKTTDITYAVVEQGNSMPRTAPKKPLRTYETEYVITMIYKPYFCGAVADPVYGLQFPPLPFSFRINPKLRTHIACCTRGYWYCTLHFTFRAGE